MANCLRLCTGTLYCVAPWLWRGYFRHMQLPFLRAPGINNYESQSWESCIDILGRNAFAIYILQRLPMLLLANYGLNLRPAFFIPLSILIIIPLAEAFTRLTDRIDRQLFHV